MSTVYVSCPICFDSDIIASVTVREGHPGYQDGNPDTWTAPDPNEIASINSIEYICDCRGEIEDVELQKKYDNLVEYEIFNLEEIPEPDWD